MSDCPELPDDGWPDESAFSDSLNFIEELLVATLATKRIKSRPHSNASRFIRQALAEIDGLIDVVIADEDD